MSQHRLTFAHHTFRPEEIRGKTERILAEPASSGLVDGELESIRPSTLLERNGVGAVILIHGTFAGNDIVGLMREIARFSPVSASRLRELSKRWLDELVGEVGNYTKAFAEKLSGLISTVQNPIPVHCFQWSGENHHLGRADGVMALIELFNNLPELQGSGRRVLVLAHSHGGNLLAMLSQLVGADRNAVETFFRQSEMHYHSPLRRRDDLLSWVRARERLLGGCPFPPIDVATFGTPLRYRWDRRVCPNLLHFVQHRTVDPNEPNRAVLPRSPQDVYDSVAGDYVQHFGIAGTDFWPSFFAWRDWIVERRMSRMLESTARRRDLWSKLKLGRRESSDGTTLLVDYASEDNPRYRSLFGHGVYTCEQWLPFHLREITERFYATQALPPLG